MNIDATAVLEDARLRYNETVNDSEETLYGKCAEIRFDRQIPRSTAAAISAIIAAINGWVE